MKEEMGIMEPLDFNKTSGQILIIFIGKNLQAPEGLF